MIENYENRFHVPVISECARCGRPATHFCTACRMFLCDAPGCNIRSAALALVAHPVISTRVILSKIRRL